MICCHIPGRGFVRVREGAEPCPEGGDMLAVTRYPKDYVTACRKRMDEQLAAYTALAKSGSKADSARFEPLFCANLVLALDACFVHRTRGLEGKDGNPLNEVRMLCASILQHDAVLTADKTIKYDPERSVLKLAIGDRVALSAADFKRVAAAFFQEIGAKFV
jgi:hypothetical protein